MNIDFEYYRIFYVVAKNKNITAASKELNISQPAISKAIKKLEEQLGGELFVRTRRGVVLTSEGEEFYSYISKAIEYIYNAENRFTDLMNLDIGHIRIGVSTTVTENFLAPYLQKFHELFPNITIEIDTSVIDVLLQKLRNGLIDLIIFNVSKNDYGSDLMITPCLEVHDIFTVGASYQFLSGEEISIHDLHKYPLIFQSKASSTRRFLEQFLKTNHCELNPELELAGNHLVTLFTKMGFGVGFATKEFIQDELDKKELFPLNLKEKIPSRFIGIATSKKHVPSFSTKKLLELIGIKSD